MKNEWGISAAKSTPPVCGTFWIWVTSRDINWWVAAATLAYIGLQAFYLIRNKGRRERDDD
ncbi:hypothetical protein [Burkholderia cenocepacia]|uniref:hypothetical protein n=1 Tax=Burkholderia cenocepacia TaxID=95486 RepID=UPI002B255788|nr:hypothetical protein [Burkholderia cenocepacia]MEB2499526.1 hypothetical protein [Burkholderia cenocepacia]MEB2557201.1 hypothetical protein [Burkholderia cenocepacia]